MSGAPSEKARRLRGGIWGPILVLAFVVLAVSFLYYYYSYPHLARNYGQTMAFKHAMFGPGIEQPIAFSHRLHVTDKEIDCFYCHPYAERSLNAGLPPVSKCLGCHDYIIPEHQEIKKLRSYRDAGQPLPWVRVYYNPDHVFFPHYRHLGKGLKCQQCHGEVERVDRLNEVTFYMGFCIDCHDRMGAPRECVACHQ